MTNQALPAMVRKTSGEVRGPGFPVAWQFILVLLFISVLTLIVTVLVRDLFWLWYWEANVNPLCSYSPSSSSGTSVPLIFHRRKVPLPTQ